MQQLIQRAELLLRQNKAAEAKEVLSQVMTQFPNEPRVLGLMAHAHLQLNQLDQAIELLNQAISFEPDNDYHFYLRAASQISKTRYDEAENDLKEAIRLNPREAEYFGMIATLKINRKDFESGLNYAERGLELDAENLTCLNSRSAALAKLNRREESVSTLEGALKEDPNNPFTHANYGWIELEKGDHRKALKHFQEALKSDPNLQYAQHGMIQALKARYFLYRLFLTYAFWMSNLSGKLQWGVILGFYFGYRLLRSVSRNNPEWTPFLQPILVLLAIVALSTWIINPISNLFLRLNQYGRHLLDEREKMSSNLVALCAITSLFGLGFYLFVDPSIGLALLVFGFAMMIPCGSLFATSSNKYILPGATILLALLGLTSIVTTVSSGEAYNQFSLYFTFGFIGYQFLANFVVIKEDNR